MVWTDPAHASLAGATLEQMGSAVDVVGVGGIRRSEVADLAKRFGHKPLDDARSIALFEDADQIFITAAEGFGPQEIRVALDGGRSVMTTHPVVCGFDDVAVLRTYSARGGRSRRRPKLSAASDGRAAGDRPAAPAPGDLLWAWAFEDCPGWVLASDPLEATGTPRLISAACSGGRGGAATYDRVFDAWRTVVRIAGVPESIDASLCPLGGAGPERPTSISGHYAAHARLAGDRGVLIRCGGAWGPSRRTLEIIGDDGSLWVDDYSYRLRDASGSALDNGRSDRQVQPDETLEDACLIASRWRRALGGETGTEIRGGRLPGQEEVLACVVASLLSARTGGPESPRKLLDLHRS